MLITNATVVTGESPNRILPSYAVLLSDSRIADVGPAPKLEQAHPKTRRLDAGGQLVLPGGISHTHFY
jgi:cytosine/adenosine deaminase-related metal-dependent hydrolase